MKKTIIKTASMMTMLLFASTAFAINTTLAEVQNGLAVVQGNKAKKHSNITWEGSVVTLSTNGGAFSFYGEVPSDCTGTLSDGVSTVEITLTNCQSSPPILEFSALAKTGQVTSYFAGDDGDLQIGVASPSPRFIDNGDTATDRLTGLTWTKDASQYQIQWTDALASCNASSVGAQNGWRIPNIKELMSILDFSQALPMLPAGHPFTGVNPDPTGYGYYWSSTTNAVFDSKNDAYVVNLNSGEIRIWPKRSAGNVLCVWG